jgi:hypothetical protein
MKTCDVASIIKMFSVFRIESSMKFILKSYEHPQTSDGVVKMFLLQEILKQPLFSANGRGIKDVASFSLAT